MLANPGHSLYRINLDKRTLSQDARVSYVGREGENTVKAKHLASKSGNLDVLRRSSLVQVNMVVSDRA